MAARNSTLPRNITALGEQAPLKPAKKAVSENYIVPYKPPKGKDKPTGAKKTPGKGAPLKPYKLKPTKEQLEKDKLRARRTNDPTNYLIRHSYNMHRTRVETARPVVDSSCPIVAKNTYSSPTAFNRRIANFARIERENAILTERISKILQGTPYVDCRAKPPPPILNHARSRQLKLIRITFENLALLKRIQDQKTTYGRQAQIKEYDKREKAMERLSYYPLFWKQKKIKGWEAYEDTACRNAQNNPKPRVYMDLATDVTHLGRIIIELRADVVPMTAENFRALCTGEYGLSYKCSKIHRIVPDILWQGGDVSGMDGYGNKSIYGSKFPNENFRLKHGKAGVVSMANIGEDTNGSQFIIDARPMPALDKKNVVVGQVIAGMKVLFNSFKLVTSTGRIRRKVWILGCGEISPEEDISGYLDSDEEGEERNNAIEDGDEFDAEGESSKQIQSQSQNQQQQSQLAPQESTQSASQPNWILDPDEKETLWEKADFGEPKEGETNSEEAEPQNE